MDGNLSKAVTICNIYFDFLFRHRFDRAKIRLFCLAKIAAGVIVFLAPFAIFPSLTAVGFFIRFTIPL
jgi:hypothetical protein